MCMGRTASLSAGLGLAAFLALAARAQEVSPLTVKPGGVVFISPAGEPFRRGADMTLSMKQWFDRADSDHDGALTLAEFQADHVHAFGLWDEDGDGVIDGREISHYEYETAPEVLSMYDRVDRVAPIGPRGAASAKPSKFKFGKRPPELTGAAQYSVLNEPEPISVADTDVDFRVSAAEWRQAADRRFAQLDVNHDGKITFDELVLPPEPQEEKEPKIRRTCPPGYDCR